MTLDFKWLDILKERGWKTFVVAIACGMFLLAAQRGWIPPLEPWMTQLATFGLLLCSLLTITSLITTAYKFFHIKERFDNWIAIRRAKNALRNYIPYMTPEERKIIAYLLAKNQKTFTAEASGGHPMTLLSRGIVQIVAQTGQIIDSENVPMIIPDHLWEVLMEHKNDFPYISPKKGEIEVHPWRVHWMER